MIFLSIFYIPWCQEVVIAEQDTAEAENRAHFSGKSTFGI